VLEELLIRLNAMVLRVMPLKLVCRMHLLDLLLRNLNLWKESKEVSGQI